MDSFAARLALTLLIVFAALPAAAGAALPSRFFGVMVNGPLDDTSRDLDAEAGAMRAAGVRSWRVEFAWDLIEPQPGTFDWAKTDRKVLAAARQRIAVLGLALRAPAWANGGDQDPFVPPADPRRFGAFTAALVGRYGPSGSLWRENPDVAAVPVRDWEVWNEPNLRVYFRSQPFERPYARLVRAAYGAIKRADPKATVLLASMANDSWRALAKLLDAPGPRLRFDAAGAHPFSGRTSNALKIVRLNREVLDRRGRSKVPLWLTELTWSSAKGKKTPLTQNWETTEAGQAERLTSIYRLLLRDRKRLRLERVFWYTWATVDQGSPNSFDYSGLVQMTPDGVRREKPALSAFRRIATR